MTDSPAPSRALSERLVEFSRDQDAFREYRELFFEAKSLPFWKRRKRRELEERAAAARERAVAAGIDFSQVPTPPARFTSRIARGDARSALARRRIGSRLRPRSRRAPGERCSRAQAECSAGSPCSACSAARRRSQAQAAAPREAERGRNTTATSTTRTHRGTYFSGEKTVSFQAVGADGLHWGEGADGAMLATDGSGNNWSMNEQGDLSGVDANGQQWFLGDDGNAWAEGADGGFYTVGADGGLYGWAPTAISWPPTPALRDSATSGGDVGGRHGRRRRRRLRRRFLAAGTDDQQDAGALGEDRPRLRHDGGNPALADRRALARDRADAAARLPYAALYGGELNAAHRGNGAVGDARDAGSSGGPGSKPRAGAVGAASSTTAPSSTDRLVTC